MKKEIVFVKRNPQIRILKQAIGLKKTGRYKLVLVASSFDLSLFKDVFDRIIVYKNYKELQEIISSLNPYLFHAHAEPNLVIAVVIQSTKRPVVYDAYDFTTLSGRDIQQRVPQIEKDAERFALENADGIVYKGSYDQIKFYLDKGYNIKAPTLNYDDYCGSDFFVNKGLDKLSSKDGEIHIVHIGVIVPLSFLPEKFGHGQFGKTAIILAKNGIHFHTYYNPYQSCEENYPCYRSLSQKLSFFHFHRGVPHQNLHLEISQYDFGSYLAGDNIPKEIPLTWFRANSGNKLFSYLESGIPIIISEIFEYNCSFIYRYGIGIVVDNALENINLIKDIISYGSYEQLVNNVKEARRVLSIENQVPRLEEFYAKIV
jgi:hypothetical protein